MPEATREIVPTIDISPMFGEILEKKLEVAKQIDDAFRSSGFFYASGHGINLADLFKKTTQFHQAISDKEKRRIAIRAWNKDNVKQIRNGYQPPNPKKPVEAYCYLNPQFTEDHPLIQKDLPLHEVNVWPDPETHPGFRDYSEDYFNKCYELSKFILRAIALALGKEEKFFDQYFRKEDNLSSVVLIRYPYLKDYPPVLVAPDGQELGFGSHVDVGFLTVLAQTNIQNLQVLTEEGYVDIPPSGEHFLINGAGYMEHMTNGYYKSFVHRVKHRNTERLSLPFFANLGYYDTIEPFSPADTGIKNEPLQFGKYLERGLLKLIEENGQR